MPAFGPVTMHVFLFILRIYQRSIFDLFMVYEYNLKHKFLDGMSRIPFFRKTDT